MEGCPQGFDGYEIIKDRGGTKVFDCYVAALVR
jgi:hypothetical protein